MSRKVLAAAMAAVMVSGCMPTRLGASGGSPQTCMAENARFLDAWTCVRARLVARQKDDAGHESGLVDEGDLLAAQVRAGTVSDAEARKRLDRGLAHDAS